MKMYGSFTPLNTGASKNATYPATDPQDDDKEHIVDSLRRK
ncbi:Uncharacterised protein [Mycobacteroides abscessus subsp. abscessus]|nr:Uncharacterised protein [Mycobacteroides abscessus subsp. abscessus]